MPALRPKPQKFYKKEELEKDFNIKPNTNFKKWNHALKEMGFNYIVKIEPVSKKYGLYSIKFIDQSVGIEAYMDEVGYGFSQFLPFLGNKFEKQRGKKSERLFVLEQPELHLHPKAQAALPKILVKSYSERAGKIMEGVDSEYYTLIPTSDGKYPITDDDDYIIETHSEHIVRGIQLLVAKGFVRPEEVSINYIGKRKNGNSFLEEFELDEKGKFKNKWPEGFFDTGFKQAMELMKAR